VRAVSDELFHRRRLYVVFGRAVPIEVYSFDRNNLNGKDP